MFASRELTGSERNYQNLERECLATIWGMENSTTFSMERRLPWKLKNH